MIAYVYVLHDPESGDPKYVGISQNPVQRIRKHLDALSTPGVSEWVRGLRPKIPRITLLDPFPSRDHAKLGEIELIRSFRGSGYVLLNLTIGGDSGPEWTAANRKNLSAAIIEMYTRMSIETKRIRSQRIWQTRQKNGTLRTSNGYVWTLEDRIKNGHQISAALESRTKEEKALHKQHCKDASDTIGYAVLSERAVKSWETRRAIGTDTWSDTDESRKHKSEAMTASWKRRRSKV